uniref:PRELI/MSF1 domain-containing protein n=1 Tax=Ditylenchus dipsaci TaxID=166011 RepID=A0A915E3T0_9BILA
MRVWEAPLFNFNYGFNDVSAVFYNRYPNSFAKHIISEDVISREITEERIITRKLIVKKAASFLKSVPSWMSRLTSVQYMPTIEESVFDKKNMTLKTYTRNICWKNILNMDERCIYQSLESNKTIVSRSLYLSVTYGKSVVWFSSRVIHSPLMTSSSHSFWKAACTLSLLSLVHCAYSAAQHRSYLRLTRLEFTYLPSDIVVQTIISLVLTIFSASFVAGDFQQIRADLQANKKSWDTAWNCPSFYVFDHRAKCLSPRFDASDD